MKAELKPYPDYHAARVSWAASIPVSWETGWLGECSRTIQTGPFGSQLHAEEYQADGIPVINPSNIIESKVVPDWEITISEEKARDLGRHRFKTGDLVFARRGEMGRCAAITANEEGWLCGRQHVSTAQGSETPANVCSLDAVPGWYPGHAFPAECGRNDGQPQHTHPC